MLKRQFGSGLVITYRKMGNKYYLLSDSSAYLALPMDPTNENCLILLDQEDNNSANP